MKKNKKGEIIKLCFIFCACAKSTIYGLACFFLRVQFGPVYRAAVVERDGAVKSVIAKNSCGY